MTKNNECVPPTFQAEKFKTVATPNRKENMMLVTDKNNKILFIMIELSQILKQYKCTYNEAEQIISDLQFELKRQQEEKEYNSLTDYFTGIKAYNCGNEVIKGREHFEMEVDI